ncbi:ABC transporter permease [Streptomyces sp. NBC_01142]|uniref:ABC transporter permease n=1 Tax=Streptomyces sp. NBC_01142 TaxID=2975865 RepID=UPI00224CA5ED|nr:ABC transporter permease [Streptomyces sp. NBC_01142]MCX4824920.1 ABC transporter permease [Streptomyces sp. NBC_01142]
MSATPTHRMIAVMVLAPMVVALALWAFAWPAARTAPRDVPIGIAGPATAVTQLEQHLEQREGTFDIHRYADGAAARAAIEDRVVYGAVVVADGAPQLLTASAASPVAAQLLKEAVTSQAPSGTQVQVTDVVPTPPGDPRGSALAASILPLALAGVAVGAVVTFMRLRGTRAATSLVGASVLVGLTATALAHSWLGVLTGPWWTEAGVLGLTVLAIGAAVAGLGALLRTPGIALGALLVVLLGNPFSGAASAPELLPEPVGVIGQWLPPGAGATLLRSVTYFDGSGAAASVLTLSIWAALGLAAMLITGSRGGRTPAVAAEHREAAPAPVG